MPAASACWPATTARKRATSGLPFVGIGFMYPQGYFHQSVSSDGWQEERYRRLGWEDAPIEPAVTPDGKPCIIAVPLGQRTVLVSVWHVKLGHTHLYLLDTDLEENAPWDRELSARLYGGDRETRIQQEIILGIGGVRALRALGIDPAVWHLNEGHAGFVVLQRIHEFLEQGLLVRRRARAKCAGARSSPRTRRCPPATTPSRSTMVETHLAGCWGHLGDHREDFLALGRHDNGHGTLFNMTALALRSAELRQRRQPAARRGDARDVGAVLRQAGRPGAGRRHHQRRPPGDVGRRRRRPALRSLPRLALARSQRRSGDLGADPRHPRRRAVEAARRRCAAS